MSNFRRRLMQSLKGILTKISGTVPLLLKNAKNKELQNYTIYGNSVQDGTPTPDNPVEIQSVGERTENLFDKKYDVSYSGSYPNISTNTNGLSTEWYETSNIGTKFTVALNVKEALSSIVVGFVYSDDKEILLGRAAFFNSSSLTTGVDNFSNRYLSSVASNAKYVKFYISNASKVNDIRIYKGTNNNLTVPYGYKIPVTVRGENYFNLSKVKVVKPSIEGFKTAEVLVNGIKVYQKYASISASYDFIAEKDMIITFRYKATSTEDYYGYAWIIIDGKTYYNVKSGTVFNLIAGNKVKINFAWNPYNNGVNQNSSAAEEVTFTDIRLEEVEPITTNIYLDEPLRKVGNYADYINFENKKIVRKVEVIDNTGLLTLEESLKGLEKPTEETIELPNILTLKGTNIITVDTTIEPSKMEVAYWR